MARSADVLLQSDTRIVNPTLLMVAVMWGAGNVVSKWVLEVLEPAVFLALRMGVLAPLLIALSLTAPRRRIAPRDWLMLAGLGGGVVAVQHLTFSCAMKMTTASEGSLLISTAPVWTAVAVAVLGMELVTRLNWLGILVASCGVAMIVLGSTGAIAGDAPARLWGNLVMVASAWMYGGFMVMSKRWMRRIGALHVVCYAFAAAGIMLAVTGIPQLLDTDWTRVSLGRWLGLGYTSLLAGFVGLTLWYRSIGRTSASRTAVYQYLVPGVSVVVAAVFLGERIAMLQLAGIAVAMVGVYLARVPPRAVAVGATGERLAAEPIRARKRVG